MAKGRRHGRRIGHITQQEKDLVMRAVANAYQECGHIRDGHARLSCALGVGRLRDELRKLGF